MYLFIYYLIPEDTSYYLLPDEIVFEYKIHLERLCGVVVNGDTLSSEQDESFDVVNSLVEGWSEYKVEIPSIMNTPLCGVYTFRYIM